MKNVKWEKNQLQNQKRTYIYHTYNVLFLKVKVQVEKMSLNQKFFRNQLFPWNQFSRKNKIIIQKRYSPSCSTSLCSRKTCGNGNFLPHWSHSHWYLSFSWQLKIWAFKYFLAWELNSHKSHLNGLFTRSPWWATDIWFLNPCFKTTLQKKEFKKYNRATFRSRIYELVYRSNWTYFLKSNFSYLSHKGHLTFFFSWTVSICILSFVLLAKDLSQDGHWCLPATLLGRKKVNKKVISCLFTCRKKWKINKSNKYLPMGTILMVA